VLVPITTEALVEQARRLGEEGHRYTSRQLYYAVCRAVEQPSPSATKGIIGTGALLIVLAGALLWVHTVPISLILALVGVAVLLLAPLNASTERRREAARARDSRALALSYDSFLSGPLQRALQERPDAWTGLIAASPPVAGGRRARGARRRAGQGLAVAGDRAETVSLLAANRERLPTDAQVIDGSALTGVSPSTEGGASRALAELRHRRVIVVHDADPTGCALPGALRRAGATDVVDAGIPPPGTDAGLQVIEGAPARLPAGLEADLPAAQAAWLRSGRRLELATLTPKEVMALVLAAAPERKTDPDPGA